MRTCKEIITVASPNPRCLEGIAVHQGPLSRLTFAARHGEGWFRLAIVVGLLVSLVLPSLPTPVAGSPLPQAATDLRFLDAALKPGRGAPVKALAYCFCGF